MDPNMNPMMPPGGTASPAAVTGNSGSPQTQMTPEQLQQAIMMMNLLGQGQQGMGNQMMQQASSLGGMPTNSEYQNMMASNPGISPQAYQAMFGGAM